MKKTDALFEQLERIVRSDKPVWSGDVMIHQEVYQLRDLGLVKYQEDLFYPSNSGYVATQLGIMTCRCAVLQHDFDQACDLIKQLNEKLTKA